LYPSFAKMAAKEQGADDAWLIDPEGFVNEGTSNNAYIVKDGEIITRHLSHDILHGITRATVLELAAEAQMKVVERPFTIEEAQGAEEAFITAASTFVCPVVKIDGVELGDGKPGPLTRRLREIYIANAKAKSI
ncbi:MAG: aminotransferase class IV, partial [Pseudomonadota bacterium]